MIEFSSRLYSTTFSFFSLLFLNNFKIFSIIFDIQYYVPGLQHSDYICITDEVIPPDKSSPQLTPYIIVTVLVTIFFVILYIPVTVFLSF